jgi:hypothetical protein
MLRVTIRLAIAQLVQGDDPPTDIGRAFLHILCGCIPVKTCHRIFKPICPGAYDAHGKFALSLAQHLQLPGQGKLQNSSFYKTIASRSNSISLIGGGLHVIQRIAQKTDGVKGRRMGKTIFRRSVRPASPIISAILIKSKNSTRPAGQTTPSDRPNLQP